MTTAQWPTGPYARQTFLLYLKVWIGSGIAALVVLSMLGIFVRSGVAEDPTGFPERVLSFALVAAGLAEIIGVYAWHIPHYGFTFDAFSMREKIIMATAQSFGAAVLVWGIGAGGDGPTIRLVSSALLFAAASLFCGTYIHTIRNKHVAAADW